MLGFIFKIIYNGFRIFVYLIALHYIWKGIQFLLRSYVEREKAKYPRRPDAPPAAKQTITGQMVRDPICGTHVATELAIQASHNGSILYFCSENCKKAFYLKK